MRFWIGGSLVFLLWVLSGCGSFVPLETTVTSFKELRTRNLVLQKHEYTCGAAALATTMNILGEDRYTERGVLKTLGNALVRKKGTYPALSLAHLVKAARRQNFKVITFRTVPGTLSRKAIQALRPLIVRLKLEKNYAHFVVVRGEERGWVYISDPAVGNFRLPWTDFHQFWKKGGSVFLTLTRKQFVGWRDEQGTLHVRREKLSEVPTPRTIAPYALYASNMRALSLLNDISR